jgi:hypothetical protein
MLREIALCALAFLGASRSVDPRPGMAPAPQIRVMKATHDAGQMAPGAKLTLVFPIQNAGTAPLRIQRVRLSCGCLAAEYDRELRPGGRGAVRIVFDTSGRRGRVEKHVTIESNDPNAPVSTLTIRALLRHKVEVAPSEEIAVPIDEGEPAQQELIVRSYEKAPLRIARVLCSSPGIRTRLLTPAEVADRVPDDPKTVQIVEVTVPARNDLKASEETITLITSSAARPRIPVRLSLVPRGAVAASPPHLYLGQVASRGAEPLTRAISLFRKEGPFRVLRVDAPPPLRARVDPDPSGRLADVTVTYTGGWKPGMVSGVITIVTDDPQRPRIRVPYTAEVSDEPEPGPSVPTGRISLGKEAR